jgi:hypothetical protein
MVFFSMKNEFYVGRRLVIPYESLCKLIEATNFASTRQVRVLRENYEQSSEMQHLLR